VLPSPIIGPELDVEVLESSEGSESEDSRNSEAEPLVERDRRGVVGNSKLLDSNVWVGVDTRDEWEVDGILTKVDDFIQDTVIQISKPTEISTSGGMACDNIHAIRGQGNDGDVKTSVTNEVQSNP